ncbi:glycosyltransferase family 4 protein [Specibacter sp. RAF43]|uniref:glycosyltransferase family 4 protein n=1 Tax=Specibacter sp. RAF43 TaxID=3233057 RepID=UPI003F9C3F5C
MSIIRNLWVAGATAAQHFTDDPVLLALQISRRLPPKMVQPAARAVCRAMPRSTAAPVLIAAHVSGDADGLGRRLDTASLVTGRRARIAAEVALAAGLPEKADAFITRAVGARKLPATLARRKWYSGDMSGAVETLQGRRGAAGRQHDRLAGELRTYSGGTPTLPQIDFTPVDNRVLHLLTNSLPHTGSGYAQRSHSILTAQRDAGLEVLAVTRLGYPVQVGKVLARDEDVVDGVRYQRIAGSSLAATPDARLQQEAERLLDIALEFRPSVLHTTTHFVNGLVVGAVAKALGIPWVYEVRGLLADTWASTRGDSARESERYVRFQACEARVMQDADLVVTLGEAMKASLVAAGVPSQKIMLAPNAVGGPFLAEPRAPEEARRELGLDPALQYIGTVSSLVDYEGLDDLVDAFSLLVPNFPNLRLLIVGSGTAGPALERQADDLGLLGKVIFTGRVARDLTPLYHQALDVFVVPRRDLAVTRAVTPLKPVEALASARPVVASDLPALREIIDEDMNGRLTPAGNSLELSRVLSDLLADGTACRRLGLSGRVHVLQTRTWSANANASMAAYAHLAAARKGGTTLHDGR